MKGIVDRRLLSRAILVGVVLEVILVVASWYKPWVREHFLLFGAMMVAGTAGLLYARELARGFAKGALGGLAIGAACGLSAVSLSNVLDGQPEIYLPYGVMVMTLTGMIGGVFGQIDAIMRAFFKSTGR
jgi:general stress protein CsbA